MKNIPKKKLEELGFKEGSENLWMKEIKQIGTGNIICLYHDYRSGRRKSYAYDDVEWEGEPFYEFKEFKEYKIIKFLEMGSKCKRLSDF